MHKLKKSCGFTIVELMVSMVIGLALVILVIQLYLSSNASHRLHDDNLRLQQDGRYVMQLMEKNLRNAGFGNVTSLDINAARVDSTDFVDRDGNPGQGLRGCDNGFNKPTTSPPDFSCKNSSAGTGATAAAFAVAYRVSDSFDSFSGAGADCNGAEAKTIVLPTTHPAFVTNKPVHIVANLFFVTTPARGKFASLYCNGNGGTIAQPILDNVEDLRLTYGVAAVDGDSTQQFLNAAGVDVLSSDLQENWRRVISVKLCLQIVGATNITAKIAEAQHYIGCDGVARIANDRKLRAVLTSVTMLRNGGGSGGG